MAQTDTDTLARLLEDILFELKGIRTLLKSIETVKGSWERGGAGGTAIAISSGGFAGSDAVTGGAHVDPELRVCGHCGWRGKDLRLHMCPKVRDPGFDDHG